MDNNRGILYMPCGTGKTLVCHWIIERLEHKDRICIVVPSLYLLSQVYAVWVEMRNDNYLLVGSDVEIDVCKDTGLILTTDEKTIRKFLRKHDRCVIITTYQSSERFADACIKLNYELDMIVFDEAHKTVGNRGRLFSCMLEDDNIRSKKRLYATATKKIFKYKLRHNSTVERIYSMDDVQIYGKVITNYSTREAIDSGQLCDYKIVAPYVHSGDYRELLEGDEHYTKLVGIAVTIIKTIKERNVKHLLIFSNRNKRAEYIARLIRKISAHFDLNVCCEYLDGTSSMDRRHRVVDSFIKSEIGIISSARIFGEGVNIPECDAVCFADNKCSAVDIVQCVGRCLRKCSSYPDKIAHIIVPFVLGGDIEDFYVDHWSFNKLRCILKSLGTTDDTIVENFSVVDCSEDTSLGGTDGDGQCERMRIVLEEFEKEIITKIFDRDGTPEDKIRGKLVHENMKRYSEGCELIDTRKKCLDFLGEKIPEQDNWVKYCLGDRLFAEIKKRYYDTHGEVVNACHKLNINNFERYKKKHRKDPKLPPSDYINDGFYGNFDMAEFDSGKVGIEDY